MMAFLRAAAAWTSQYSYFVEAIALLLLAGAAAALLRRHSRALLLAGAFSAPAGLMAPLFNPSYWRPTSVVNCTLTPEDVMFSAGMGTIACFFALLPFHRRIEMDSGRSPSLRRAAACSAVGMTFIGIFFFSFGMPSNPMPPILVGTVVLAAVLLALRREFLPLALAGAAGYTVFHTVFLAASLQIWPHTRAFWTPAAQLSVEILGVPAYEVLWAAAYGLAAPLLMGHVFNARWRPPPA